MHRSGRSDLLVIRVTLPPNFPDAPPRAEVQTAGVRHPWVDKVGAIVGCSSLYSWNQHSRLAHVVGDIMQQFVQNPPQVNASSNSTTPYPGNSQGGSRDSRRSSISKTRQDSADDDGVFIPPTPDSFPELDNMTLEELKTLQSDETEFRKLFNSQNVPTMVREMHEQITKSNQDQARKNLQFKESIEQLQQDVLAQQTEAVEQWKEFEGLSKRHKTAMAQFDPLRLLTQLEASFSSLDDESEMLSREFLDEEVPLSDFIKRELDLRKLYHLRRAKAERFRSQLKH